MTPDQVQQIVDAENKRLNEIALEKATARLRDIQSVNKQIDNLRERRAELQKEISNLKFDSVTAADIVGDTAAEG